MFVIEAVFISNKLQSAEMEQHFERFITILYDFEKQFLSSFAWKAIVIRSVPQKFICLVKKEEWNLLKRGKKCEWKYLIWHMVGEMVKK